MENQPATEGVKPSISIATAHRSEPSSIYGRRRPYREVELSARTPTEFGRIDSFEGWLQRRTKRTYQSKAVLLTLTEALLRILQT